jgi:hypothetical protein
VLEAFQAPLPAIELADHRGFDDQILPSPRRAQRAGKIAIGFTARDLRVGFLLRLEILGRSSSGSMASTISSAGGDQMSALPASLRGTWPSETYSANRRADNSSSAQASNASRARPAGSGRPRAAMKPRGDAGALEGVFEHAEISLRRTQEDRHLVERHTARGFLQ